MSELIRRLMTPFLPDDVRYRLRQQRLDAEAAGRTVRVLSFPEVSVAVLRTEPGDWSPEPAGAGRVWGWGAVIGNMLRWDGTWLTVFGDQANPVASWRPREGGVLPGFGAEEIARIGQRPITSGECPDRVVEVAAVKISGFHIGRLCLLDEESRAMAVISQRMLDEDEIATVARNAGVVFRLYALTTRGRVPPAALCDALFPPSARMVRVVGAFSNNEGWL